MPQIKIRAFGHIASLLGSREVMLSCDGPLPVSAILQELRSRYPLFANYLRQQREITDNLMIGNGGLELRLDSIVEPGQELVLVTPVSGG